MTQQHKREVNELVESAANVFISSVDADGYPTAATITPSKTEGIRWIAIGNNRGSNWTKRSLACNRASVCYSADHPECNITLVGTMDVLTDDLSLKQEMWSEWMSAYYSGPEDPSFIVLRFKTERYSLYIDGMQVRGMV